MIDELFQLIEQTRDGKLSQLQVVSELRALAIQWSARSAKGRGRPTGSRTKVATPAVQRAREFLLLQIRDGLRPAQAAANMASRGIDTSNIYKELDRHRTRLGEEVENESEDAFRRLHLELIAALDDLSRPELFDDWCVELAYHLNRNSKSLADIDVRLSFITGLLRKPKT